MNEVFGFSEQDAVALLDLLTPPARGAKAPRPVDHLSVVLVKVTVVVSAASGATPGTGTGVMVYLVEAPGPTYTVHPLSPTVNVPIKSLRSSTVSVDSLVLAVRDQLRNEWWIS